MLFTGVVSSPNFPEFYPPNMAKTETIQVESGKVLRLDFTSFAVHHCTNCDCDHVKITDGDGTTLMDKSCGYSTSSPTSSSYFVPPVIVSNTNTVEIFFHTDTRTAKSGWSLRWTAVTPGPKTLPATIHYTCTVECFILRPPLWRFLAG